DRCNAALPATGPGALPDHITLPDGLPIDCSAWAGHWPADCWRHLATTAGGRRYRVYALNRSWWRDLAAVVHERSSFRLDVLAPISVVPVGEGAVVVAESLADAASPLAGPVGPPTDLFGLLDDTLAACRLIGRALRPLHDAGLVWLTFDPAGIETAGESVRVSGLDLQLFRAGACPDSLRLSAAYSPLELCAFRGDRIGPATDVFHVSLYAYYRLAGLLPDGFPGNGLEAFDFDIPPLR